MFLSSALSMCFEVSPPRITLSLEAITSSPRPERYACRFPEGTKIASPGASRTKFRSSETKAPVSPGYLSNRATTKTRARSNVESESRLATELANRPARALSSRSSLKSSSRFASVAAKAASSPNRASDSEKARKISRISALGLNPHNASKGVMAIKISGLWESSL